jgi:tetratricopeptide (TPR) repeat protein
VRWGWGLLLGFSVAFNLLASIENCAKTRCNLGAELIQEGRITEAIQLYEKTLRFTPYFPEAHYNLGVALVRLDRLPETMGHWEQALRIKPDYAEAHYNLGLALARRGRLPEAIGHWEQTLQIDRNDAEAHYNLGLAFEQTGRIREAIGHYEQALRINPDSTGLQNNLAWLLATFTDFSDPVRAVTLAERACKLTNHRVAAYLDTLAAAYAAADRFNDAIATAQKAIELANDAGRAQVAREIQSRLQLYREKRAYHRSVDGTNPHNP